MFPQTRTEIAAIETHVALGEGPCLTNLVTTLALGEGAELVHDRLELGRDATGLVGRSAGADVFRQHFQTGIRTLPQQLGQGPESW